jgi:nucleotide-binding universal stress UspA family protein
MDKKVLVAVDGSRASLMALDYVAVMEAAVVPDLWVTLFHVEEAVPHALRREMEKRPESFHRLKAMEDRIAQRTAKILESSRQRLLDAGLDPAKVECAHQARGMGLARDIVFRGEHGNYDAVVLGRRGLSKVEEMFLGSVTNKVVQHASRVPVWVVGGLVKSCRILCAVDASEGSIRAVDHLGFMLSGNKDCRVTLFHAGPNLSALKALDMEPGHTGLLSQDIMRDDLARMAAFYEEARRLLAQSGLEPDQIEMISRESSGVAKAIMEQLRQGQYGTVVLGRRGEGQAFWLGHVSDRILKYCQEAAVWVVG